MAPLFQLSNHACRQSICLRSFRKMLCSDRTAAEPLDLMRHVVALCLQLHGTQSEARIAAFRAVLNTINSSGNSILRSVNDAAPVNRLSDDLLTRLLSYVSLRDWPSASRVCHRWTSIFARINQCWGDMELWDSDDNGGFTRATTRLTRFPNGPVSLNLRISTHGSALADFLSHHMKRARRLCLSIMPTAKLVNDTLSCRSLVLALEEPAPVLEDLDIWGPRVHRTGSEETYLSEALFAGLAPRLRSLTLHGLALHDRTYSALMGLRALYLCQAKVDIAQIVASYPALEELLIDAPSIITGTGENWSSRHLKVLQLPGTTQAAEIVCNRMGLDRPLTVWAQAREDGLFAYVLAHTPRHRACRLRFLFQVDNMQPACVIEYSSGITWIVELWREHLSLALCDAELMASIAELTIHELLWPGRPLNLPSLLNVTLLEVVLYRPSLAYLDPEDLSTVVGTFSENDESLCTLHCPALETLSFVSPTQPALAVDVLDVLGVIERRLRFSADLLPCLRLRNVSLYDPANGRGVELLTARVQRVEYCKFQGRDSPFVHQKRRSMSWIYEMI